MAYLIQFEVLQQLEGYDHANDEQLHTLMRQAGDWLAVYHKEKL